MNKNRRYIYIGIIFFNFIFPTEEVNNSLTFNVETIIDGSLTVQNNVTCNGEVTVNGKETIFNGPCTINNNTAYNSIVFGDNSTIQFENLNISTDDPVLYLYINKANNTIFTSDKSILQGPVIINSLIVNTISNTVGKNLYIENENGSVEIGNNDNIIIFNKNLFLPNIITITNPDLTITAPIKFKESLIGDNIIINGATVDLKSDNTNETITIEADTCEVIDTIESNGDIIFGKEDFTSQINILNDITCKNIFFGSQNNPIKKVIGLNPIDNPMYYIIINDNNFISKILSNYDITKDIIAENNITVSSISTDNGDITFNSPEININAQEITFHQSTPGYITIFNMPDKFIMNNTRIHGFWSCQRAIINPTVALVTNQISGAYKKMKFNFQKYFFYYMMILSDYDSIIGINTDNKLIRVISNENQAETVPINYKSMRPIKFSYKDTYKMHNNDMCPKNKSKIIHFGFTAENLENQNIPHLVSYDKNNIPNDYDTDLLLRLFNTIILMYEDKMNALEKKIEKIVLFNIFMQQQIDKQKIMIKNKTILYKKIKNTIEQLRRQGK